jgi:hypothetical protein
MLSQSTNKTTRFDELFGRCAMKTLRAILLCTLLTVVWGPSALAQELTALPLDMTLKKAQVGGKYRMLLRMLRIPEDGKLFAGFKEFGYRTETTCAEYTDLPKGYWVYVYPYWYIWRDQVTDKEPPKRAWGLEQAIGKPDTPEPGDQQTAWASRSQDDADEWLMLEYKTPVWASALHIYETYNPGAVVRVTAYTLDDREVEVWRRARPGVPTTPGAIFRPAFLKRVLSNRIKIYLDSRNVPGWNEIDAVGLKDEGGSLQWATAAHASTTYASGGVAGEPGSLLSGRLIDLEGFDLGEDQRDTRIRDLEEQNRVLRSEIEALKKSTKVVPGKG